MVLYHLLTLLQLTFLDIVVLLMLMQVSTLDITGGVNVDIAGATDLATANINIINDDDSIKSVSDKAKFDSRH